ARHGGFAGASDRVFQSLSVFDFGSALNLRFDLGGRGPYGVDALHSLPQQLVEHGVVAALIFAPKNQVNIRRERFQCLAGGVNVRGLGVVVVIHACDSGHEFQPVLDGFEIPDSLADLFGLAADKHADRNSREHIFQVVRAFQRYVRQRHDLAFAMPIPEIDMLATDKGSFFNLLVPAEPEQLRASTVRQSSGGGFIGVEHGEVIGKLVLEDARFGADVIDKSLVTIEI